jgi:predicted RNase H-like HicB family nuclease
VKFTYWEEDGWFLGYLNEFPDTWPQGRDLDDLKTHLLDLHKEFTSGGLQTDHEYHVDELVVT